MISRCWCCGRFTAPVSRYGAGRFEYECAACDVRWVAPEYWADSNAWKDNGGYAGYKANRRNGEQKIGKRYKVKMIDFGEKEAPGSPA